MTTSLIAVDPGDRHVGVAFFTTEEPDPWTGEGSRGWYCADVQEFEPDEFADALAETLLAGELDTLVVETFRLYGDRAIEQTGSQFETSQLIGVLKYLVRINNMHVEKHRLVEQEWRSRDGAPGILPCEQRGGTCQDGTPYRHVTLALQPADIKKPTVAILRKKGIKSVAKAAKAGGHCVDAETHGWRYLLHEAERAGRQ